MVNIFIAFITGLTTGGLSCLAVQGGLLASSLANQIERDLQVSDSGKGQAGKRKQNGKSPNAGLPQANRRQANNSQQVALPILAFLGAKLLAYTILGFLLGWVGSMFQLSPQTRSFLQIAIGIFMIGSALRMLNVHPIFRFFAFEPPAFLRRRIRKTAAANASVTTPILLGFLTVLIPCGITQAMMAVALSTGSPIEGAVTMIAFTLGASPVFFAVAYFATRLGAKLEKHFMRFVAVVLLILGAFSIDTGLTLAGSPLSLTRVMNNISAQKNSGLGSAVDLPAEELQVFEPKATGPDSSAPVTEARAEEDENVITINITNYGYEPRIVHAKSGVPVKLKLVSGNVYSCALAFVIPTLDFQEYLKPNAEAWVEIPAQGKGTQMPFSCSMGMYTGGIIFDL